MYEYLRTNMREFKTLDRIERLERISRVIRFALAVGLLMEKVDKYCFNIFKFGPSRRPRSPRQVDSFKNLKIQILKQLRRDVRKGRQNKTL